MICILGFLQLIVIGVSADPISFGETISGTISNPAQTDSHSFYAITGDVVRLRVSSSWQTWVRIWLYAPNGTLVAQSSGMTEGSYYADISTALDQTGTYNVLIGDPYLDNTGTYNLYIQRLNSPGHSSPLNFGGIATKTISINSELNTTTFSGNAGDRIRLRARSSWQTWVRIWLYAPNGTLVTQSSGMTEGSYYADISTALDQTGTYTVLIGDQYLDNTGTYNLYIQRLNSPGHSSPLSFGEIATKTISINSELNTTTFSGNAGDRIRLRAQSSWQTWVRIWLYAPNGTLVHKAVV